MVAWEARGGRCTSKQCATATAAPTSHSWHASMLAVLLSALPIPRHRQIAPHGCARTAANLESRPRLTSRHTSVAHGCARTSPRG